MPLSSLGHVRTQVSRFALHLYAGAPPAPQLLGIPVFLRGGGERMRMCVQM